MEPLDHTGAALRRMTQAATLQAMRDGEAMTLSEVAARTSLSQPTVASRVADLAAAGWIEEMDPVVAGGRPARRFRFASRAGYVAGMDIGAHTVRTAVADLQGEVLARFQSDVSEHLAAAERLALARMLLARTLQAAAVERTAVLAASVGTVGVVSSRGTVTHSVLPGWAGFDLAGVLATELPCPITIDNDANLAAVAEHRLGAARGYSDIAYVIAGRRTSSALILDGKVRRGHSGAAGEIGHLGLLPWATVEKVLTRPTGAAPDDDDAAVRIFGAASNGDLRAQRAVEEFTRSLAEGIAVLVLAVDPEIVVVGGGLSGGWSAYAEPLGAEIERLCLTKPLLLCSQLGRDAVLLGALRTALDRVDSDLLGT